MLGLIDERKALDILSRYFNLLTQTGYVKNGLVKKYLAYLFLLDFVEYADIFLEDEDYAKIVELMRSIFTNGGCLLPYPTFCANRAKLMDNRYHGDGALRITEDVIIRSMEDVQLRNMAL